MISNNKNLKVIRIPNQEAQKCLKEIQINPINNSSIRILILTQDPR